MKTRRIFMAAMLLCAVAALCSCQGRKMSNMEPTGDTVEVDLTPTALAADTISQ